MPQTKFEDVIFTTIMATIMVYGMVVYNVFLNTGAFTTGTLVSALHELPIMVPIAFVLEFFVVGKIAKGMGFAFTQRVLGGQMQYIVFAISGSICLIMCPTMSAIATALFQEFSLGAWLSTFAMNLPVAFAWQLLVCGPLVRRVFNLIFRRKGAVGVAA